MKNNTKDTKPNKSKLLKLVSGFNLIFLCLFSVLSIFVALDPTVNKFGLYKPVFIIFALSLVLVVFLVTLTRYKFKTTLNKRAYVLVVVILMILSLAIQLVIARALKSYGYTWDSEIVYNGSAFYAATGKISYAFSYYIQHNPNNITLFVLLSSVFKFAKSVGYNNFLAVAVILNVIVLFITELLIFLTAKVLYGRRIALISLIFSFVFLTLSMFVPIPYSDTLAIIFPVLILFLSIVFVKSKYFWARVLVSIAIGVATLFGYLIKPTAIIATLAVLLVAVIYVVLKRKTFANRKSTLLIGTCVLAFGASILLTNSIYGRSVDSMKVLPFSYNQASKYELPLTHFMDIGLKSVSYGDTVNYGGYDPISVAAIKNMTSKSEISTYSVNSIDKTLTSYGVLGYLQFIGHKEKWITSDATFYAYGEGSNAAVTFTNNSALSKFIREFMYVDGKHYDLFGNFLQIFWLSILLLISLQTLILFIRKSARNNLYATIFRLMITGILIFLLLFEGRARYIFLYLPIFILCALYTLNWFRQFNVEKL